MPYLIKNDVARLTSELQPVMITSCGELNFAINYLAMDYLNHLSQIDYTALNAIIGAMESAKAEFQRRIVGPYENKKIRDNGDIYFNFIRKHNLPTL